MLIASLGLLGLSPGDLAAQKDAKDAKADPDAGANKSDNRKADDPKDRYIADLLTAYRLRELGEDRDNPAPEALIAAARMFRRLSKVQVVAVEAKPEIATDDKDDAPVDAADAPPDLEEQARDLLDQVRVLSLERKLGLDALIKDVEQMPLTRGAVGGPKRIARTIGAGQSHTHHMTIHGEQPWHVGFHASEPMHLTIHHDGGTTWYTGTTASLNHTFTAGTRCNMVITIHAPHHHEAKDHSHHHAAGAPPAHPAPKSNAKTPTAAAKTAPAAKTANSATKTEHTHHDHHHPHYEFFTN
jgi:hypothetical protein